MVYARALAAGFEMDNLNDLLLFSDAFGASRLREACINFRDLCKKKNEDRHWVDEIAAMQAMMQPDLSFMGTSGIVLAGDDNDTLTAGKPNGSADNSIGGSDAIQDNGFSASQTPGQMQNPWAYIRNFQGPMFQQMPPYQGYGFPGMQVAPPYYPENMSRPSDDRDSHDRHDRKSSSKKKKKASKARDSQNEECDVNTESDELSTETDSSSDRSHRLKNGKKSSRKVVIRNINYISSKRDGEKNNASETNSSDEEEHHKSTSRHQKKHNGSTHKSSVNNSTDENGNKGSESWDAFQQLLLKEDSDSNISAAKRFEEGNTPAFTPEAEKRANQQPLASDNFLLTEKGTGSHVNVGKISDESFEHDVARSSVIRSHASDEWFVRKQSDEAVNQGELGHLTHVDGVYVTSSVDQVDKRNKNSVIDDSLMIQGRLADDYSERQRRTDMSMVSDIIEASFVEKGATEEVLQKVSESKGFHEPDELYMVLDRNTTVNQTVPSWNPEIDFENNVPMNNSAKKSDTDARADLNSIERVANKKPATKASNRDARSRTAGGPMRRGKPETTSAPRRSTFGSKTTTPKSQLQKDEERKKRMEELLIRRQKRIAERASGSPVNSDKLKRQPSAEATKKPKAVLRSSTIDRLAVAKKTPNLPIPQPKNEPSKLKGTNRSQKTRDVHPKKSSTKKINPSDKKLEKKLANFKEVKPTESTDKVDDPKDIKELHVTSSTIIKDEPWVEQTGPSNKKEGELLEEHSTISDDIKKNGAEMPENSLSFSEETKVFDDHDKMSIHHVPESPTQNVTTSSIIERNVVADGSIPHFPESTPPTTNETVLESTQLRKKWDGPENSPKSAKGFRRLLMFGRRS
ncbi:hypothetical protein RND81_09G024100 [Saponaria officinalis]